VSFEVVAWLYLPLEDWHISGVTKVCVNHAVTDGVILFLLSKVTTFFSYRLTEDHRQHSHAIRVSR